MYNNIRTSLAFYQAQGRIVVWDSKLAVKLVQTTLSSHVRILIWRSQLSFAAFPIILLGKLTPARPRSHTHLRLLVQSSPH